MGIFGDLFSGLFSDSSSDFSSGPSVNIDGSPMIGPVDIHGHPFGVTDDAFSSCSHGSISDDIFSSSSSCFDDSFSSSSGSMFDD
jgi:hypothetical protein